MSAWTAFVALLALAGSLLVNVLAAETYAWLPRLANWLVRLHASRLPSPLNDRMREEWQGMVMDTPGNLAKLCRALDLFRAMPRLRHDFYCPGVPYRPIFEGLTRAVDVLVVLAGLVFSAPLMLVIIAAMKAESRGPAMFASSRLGRYRREFILYKFRTFASGGNGDFRPTRIGRLLRRTRLDELPQYFNILRGDMTLVGPRPITPNDAALLPQAPPAVFSVRPGLTGRAQVSVPYSSAERQWRRRFTSALEYVMRRGLRENLSVLLKTLRILLFGR